MQDSFQAPELSSPTTEVPKPSVKEESPYQEALPKALRHYKDQDPANHVGNFYVKEVLQFIDAFRNMECPGTAFVPLSLFHFLLDDFRRAKSGAKPFRRMVLTRILNALNDESRELFRPLKVSRYSRQKFAIVSPLLFKANIIRFPDGKTWTLPTFDELPLKVKQEIHRINKRHSENFQIYPF